MEELCCFCLWDCVKSMDISAYHKAVLKASARLRESRRIPAGVAILREFREIAALRS
jgi:hypothetical protein